MNRIEFREEALADLEAIKDWYIGIAPDALPRILDDIFRTIDQLTRYPRSGTRLPGRPARRIVTRRYHFKIIYEFRERTISITGIFRYQNREV